MNQGSPDFVNGPSEKRRTLRLLLERESLSVMPGGFSPIYARIAATAGFESFFLAGSQVAAFLYGLPDAGIMGLRDMVDHARHVAVHSPIPILADADTGYGNAVNVRFAVQEFMRAGVAGIQLEDQLSPKRSGTGAGRRCIPTDEAAGKIRAAVDAAREIDPAFVVCARTDSIGAAGEAPGDAVARCLAYAEAGADLLWLNNVQERGTIAALTGRTNVPVMILWGGAEPAPTEAELQELGVRIALVPVIAAHAGLEAAWQSLHRLRHGGLAYLADWASDCRASPYGRADWAALTGSDGLAAIEQAYLPESQQRDLDASFGHRMPFYG